MKHSKASPVMLLWLPVLEDWKMGSRVAVLMMMLVIHSPDSPGPSVMCIITKLFGGLAAKEAAL